MHRDIALLLLDGLLVILHLIYFQFKLLFELLVVILLLADYIVAFDNLLFAFSQFLLHFLNLTLVDSISIGELSTLILQRLDVTLRFLEE